MGEKVTGQVDLLPAAALRLLRACRDGGWYVRETTVHYDMPETVTTVVKTGEKKVKPEKLGVVNVLVRGMHPDGSRFAAVWDDGSASTAYWWTNGFEATVSTVDGKGTEVVRWVTDVPYPARIGFPALIRRVKMTPGR